MEDLDCFASCVFVYERAGRLLGAAEKKVYNIRVEKKKISEFFIKQELVPAIIQEARTGEVLMLAYMNQESLAKTIETGYTWFYSRSRQRLWQKGEESGNVQRVISITGDCDNDTLLIKAEQSGPACHTGNPTCFSTAPIYPKT